MAEKKKKPSYGGNPKGSEYKLSIREQKFVSLYLEYGDPKKAVIEAKFNTTAPSQYAKKLLAKPKIQREIASQMELFRNECIASSQEIMNFYTLTMRGEVKDQFGLDATLSDRLKAADALAKRQIDARALAEKASDNEFKVTLTWGTPATPEPKPEEDLDDIADEEEDIDADQ